MLSFTTWYPSCVTNMGSHDYKIYAVTLSFLVPCMFHDLFEWVLKLFKQLIYLSAHSMELEEQNVDMYFIQPKRFIIFLSLNTDPGHLKIGIGKCSHSMISLKC